MFLLLSMSRAGYPGAVCLFLAIVDGFLKICKAYSDRFPGENLKIVQGEPKSPSPGGRCPRRGRMRGAPKDLEYLEKRDAVSRPPLCKGRWLGEAETEGLS